MKTHCFKCGRPLEKKQCIAIAMLERSRAGIIGKALCSPCWEEHKTKGLVKIGQNRGDAMKR